MDSGGIATLATMKHSADHLLVLLNDVLDLAKIDSGQLVLDDGVVDFEYEAEQVLDVLFGNARQQNVRVRLELSPTVPLAVYGCATAFLPFIRAFNHSLAENIVIPVLPPIPVPKDHPVGY